ncbi:LLM class flavin-dependent oxidoreductase [Sulfuricurvum sp.]|uniref:LLM class flavin-dependent oxidoreductase n=1 Tax=Sulfuricurvum sp. TaxID=2025608 RepID=UPI002D46D549|nr:LLM class flavin-dependent oxidoreductase [Sulfuricurvum sp.]HZF69762.1 LLM class flavin-dependent oxidoreductase [Sulfuricurvum sp.]
MKFGLSGCGGGVELDRQSKIIELASYAEKLGFESLWLNEEHFQNAKHGEGRLCLSPIVAASAIAATTTKIRIGFSLLILPLYHPIRLAEELATLDLISNGRVDFGISRGGNRRYSNIFGTIERYSKDEFAEHLNLVLNAFGDKELCIGGENIFIQPKPIQKPYPPVYIGSYTKEIIEWSAQNNHNVIMHGITSMPNVLEALNIYTNSGGDVKNVPFGRFVYVSQSDENAKKELWPTILKLTDRLKNVGLTKGGRIKEEELEPENFYNKMVIAGSPETCRERISELKELTGGMNYLNALSGFFGYLPEENLRNSLELFSSEIIPKFQLKEKK